MPQPHSCRLRRFHQGGHSKSSGKASLFSPKATVNICMNVAPVEGYVFPSTQHTKVSFLVWDSCNSPFTGKVAQEGTVLCLWPQRGWAAEPAGNLGPVGALKAWPGAVSSPRVVLGGEGAGRLDEKPEAGGRPKGHRSLTFRPSRSLSGP